MTDERDKPAAGAGKPDTSGPGSSGTGSSGTGPARPRPTLDLKATEVKDAAASPSGTASARPADAASSASAAAAKPADRAGAHPAATESGRDSPPVSTPSTGPASTGSAPGAAKPGTAKPDAARADAKASATPSSGPAPSGRARSASGAAIGHWPSLLAAGVAGGVLALGGAAGILWLAGGSALPTAYAPAPAAAPAIDETRLTQLEARIADVARQAAERPASAEPGLAAADVKETVSAGLAPLAERLSRLESAPAPAATGADPATAERLAALAATVQTLDSGRNALGGRLDEIAAAAGAARERAEAAGRRADETAQRLAAQAGEVVSRDDLAAQEKRIEATAAALAALRADFDKRAGDATDRAGRLAIAAEALRVAVTSGAPFAAQLDAVRQFGAPADAVAMLAPLAASGVAAADRLARDFARLAPELRKAAGAPAPQGNFIERLQANAATLVRIRPADAPAGDDPQATVTRLDLLAERLAGGGTDADLDAVAADLARLPAETHAPAEEWLKRAGQRRDARQAADRIADAAVSALAASPKQGVQP